MKLNKNTKTLVNVGDMLVFSDSEKYRVVTIIEYNNRNGARGFTLVDMKTGMHVYSMPSSMYYGAEIVKP